MPSEVEVEVEASNGVNRDDYGASLPTYVRLYQLKDLNVLRVAGFEDVWQNAQATLGDALVEGPLERVIYPGQIVVERLERNADAHYLVAVAGFRKPAGTGWRTIDEWPLAGDPCAEKDDDEAGPTLAQLRLRMFLQEYQVASTNNYQRELPTRSCPSGKCAPSRLADEMPAALAGRRLRTFQEDPGPARPTQITSERGTDP